MKKLFLISLILVLFSLVVSAQTTITTCAQLQAMRDNLAKNYVLGDDIDCRDTVNWNSGAGFKPIGDATNQFTGSFDGNGYTITGLYINRPTEDYIGLFGHVGLGGEINNVGLEDVNIIGNSYVGGLVGKSHNINSGTITYSYSTGSVVGSSKVGGLVGQNSKTITSSYSTVIVTGGGNVGGLAGLNYGTITYSYSTGSVTGGNVGGLVGSNFGVNAAITYSYSTGSVTGTSNVGGLAGTNSGTITNSYSTGSVTGDRHVGGLAGAMSSGTITDSYSTGSVTGSIRDVGGLVGYYPGGTITNSYSTGSVNGGIYEGGLVGTYFSGICIDSFWDKETSGHGGRLDTCGTGKTTTEMVIKSTFTGAGWDFVNVWKIQEGITYPFFIWQGIPECTDMIWSSWLPSSSTKCPEETITQTRTSNCGTEQTKTIPGTKTCPTGYICQSGACVAEPTEPTAPDCSKQNFVCGDYNNFVEACNTDSCQNELGFSRYDDPPNSDPLFPCYYSELDTECKLCSEANLGTPEVECSDYDNNDTCETYPCGGPCEWEGDLDTGGCIDEPHITGAQDTVTGEPCIWEPNGPWGKKCINGIKTLEAGWGLTSGTLAGGCGPEPATTKPCLIIKKFPFFSPISIILALILLIGYYIFINKKQQPL